MISVSNKEWSERKLNTNLVNKLSQDNKNTLFATYYSKHQRLSNDEIDIYHIWINLII